MGFNQDAYDAECAALVRALEIVADRWQRHRIPMRLYFRMHRLAVERMPAQMLARGRVHFLGDLVSRGEGVLYRL